MIDPTEAHAHAARLAALFGGAAVFAADAKVLRDRAREDLARADRLEAQAKKAHAEAVALVAKGPCGCGKSADPAVLPPTQTVDSSAVTHG